MSVRVYVEGAQQGNDAAKKAAAKAFRLFVKSAGIEGVEFRLFGGRGQTHRAFCLALKSRKAEDVVLLLLDSEEPVAEGASLWSHIGNRPSDSLNKPEEATEEHLFLMICTMETWILADIENLSRSCGQGFRTDKIPQWQNLEEVPKKKIYEALDSSTLFCSPEKRYRKGDFSFRVLETVNPSVVGSKCKGAERFLDRLKKHSEGSPIGRV